MFSNATWLLAAVFAAAPSMGRHDEPRDAPDVVWSVEPHPLEVGAGLELNRALRRARSRNCDAEGILATIVGLGPQILPASLCALDERKLRGVDEAAFQVLSELQEKLILDALSGFDAASTWQAIGLHLAVPEGKLPTVAARKAAILAAGACASKNDLGRILALALLPTETELAPDLEHAVRSAAERSFRRAPQGLTLLATSWLGVPPPLRPAIVAAAGAAGDPLALELLAQMLDQPGDLQSIALAELARQHAPSEIPNGLFDALRVRLDPAQPMICLSACNAVGALGDFGSVDTLIDLVQTPWAGVTTTAHRALCHMSGLELPAQSSSWRTWRTRESEWFLHREPALLTEIQCGSERQARETLQEIGLYRWERHRLSDIAAEGLLRPEASIRNLACSVLGQLGSPRARAALEEFKSREDETGALAAQAALEKCTAH